MSEIHEFDTPQVSLNQVHWHTSDLLDVPPVLLVTEYEPVRVRQILATFIDGRHVNDALYRAINAIRREYELEPYAYIVVFPDEGFEIPIDLRDIGDRPGGLAGFVKEPRGTREVVFDFASLQGDLADHLSGVSREEAVAIMKKMSADGQEFTLHDRCAHDERFAHTFEDGVYRHNYRYVAATLPDNLN
ncbi:MAG: hypothetical protein ACOC2D_00345 [Spirochaetota bacterium]